MPVSLKKKAEILKSVRKRTVGNYHEASHNREIEVAEADLLQDLENLNTGS